MDEETAEGVQRFQSLSRAQALSGLEFLTWQERMPASTIAIVLAVVVTLLVIAFWCARSNGRLRTRIMQLEKRVKRTPIAE